jgi:uncharacterized membrane protein
MAFYLKLYVTTLAAFFAVDMLWLGLIARSLYRKYLGFLMAPNPKWAPAILFYLLFVVGILVFVVIPGLKENSWGAILWRGALFGFITYATYDLTNLATIKDWPLLITLVDVAWGAVLSVLVGLVSFLIGRWLGYPPAS